MHTISADNLIVRLLLYSVNIFCLCRDKLLSVWVV